MLRYNNYHKHTHHSGIFTPDTHIKAKDYISRIQELGHDTFFTTEHGWGGDIFEADKLCKAAGIHCKFGMEGYIVPDPTQKDKSNYHIVVVPKTDYARRKLNKASSHANKEGFYYKPRLFLSDLLAFKPNELYITTACIAGLLKDDVSTEQIFKPLMEHFGNNLFLEVQAHWDFDQIDLNKKAIELSGKYHLPLIAGCDSHYIYPEQAQDRLDFLAGKHIVYEDEGNFILDYPDYDTLFERFKSQGVLSDDQITAAIGNTLVFDECEDIQLNKTIKMPSIYKELSPHEKTLKLYDMVNERFEKICVDENLTQEQISARRDGIKQEMKTVEDTEEINTADYFLFNERLVDLATNKYGGVLTRTGRGSGGASYLNRLLGITQIDRFNVKIPFYFERFMSTARLLENHALPDIDFNVVSQEPFESASKELLGENGCYPMIAYGTMQEAEAFRNVCRTKGLDYAEFNEVAKTLDSHRNETKWKPICEEADKYIDTIVSASVHPCAFLLFDGDIEEEIGVLKIGDSYCAAITSGEADEYKYLKNDYLLVTVWKLISETFDLIGKPIMPVKTLLENIDEPIWDLYAKGITCSLNQIDSSYATGLMKRYRAHSVEELEMFIAAIRPGFNAWREQFLSKKPYTTKVAQLDEVLKYTGNYLVFQECLLQFLDWLGISPAEGISIIKKISKKKIKQSDFDSLEDRIKKVWVEKTGSERMFEETWADVQGCMSYAFNAPHAYAVALDSLYCAYLKVHYPLEYYAVALNNYEDDEERTTKLTEELSYFNIRISPPRWGKSKDKYRFDKEDRTITKSIKSIKFLNSQVANELYDLAQTHKITSFIDLLMLLKETSINSRQLDILIKIDYFSDFGNTAELLRICNIFDFFKQGDAKSVSVDKIPEAYIPLVKPYATTLNAKGQLLKSWKLIPDQMTNMLHEFEQYIRDLNLPDLPMKTRVQNSIDLLGYIGVTTGKPEDRLKVIITEFSPQRNKSTGAIWGYRLTAVSLGTGSSERLTLYPKDFFRCQIKQGDIIQIKPKTGLSKNNRGYWELRAYDKVG